MPDFAAAASSHDALSFALDFLDEHPDAAVRILEQHDARQVAAFLDAAPEPYAVLVIARALPAFAAHLCHVLGPDMSARLLLQQDVSRMVAVLRHLPRVEADGILAECPQGRRQACNLLLHYPQNFVGACIVPDAAVVSSDFTVAETRNFLSDANAAASLQYIYVVGRNGVPEGRISHLALLQAHPDQRIEWLMDKPIDCIPAQMPVAQAVKLACWRAEDLMPVTGAQQQFIGVLRHVDLRRALHQDLALTQKRADASEPLSGIVDAYGRSLLALFNTVSAAVESELKS